MPITTASAVMFKSSSNSNEELVDHRSDLDLHVTHGRSMNVPPLSNSCADSYHERSFAFGAPTEWNALPSDIRLLLSSSHVLKHLFLKHIEG